MIKQQNQSPAGRALFTDAYMALMTAEPAAKLAAVTDLASAYQNMTPEAFAAALRSVSSASSMDEQTLEQPLGSENIKSIPVPGRPQQPKLVSHKQLPKRSLKEPAGRAAFLHAIAHIEFNAINLALDALYRFRRMPVEYYRDWLRVAADEARHFQLLAQRLQDYGYVYGDFPAHNGLWDMALRTDHDVLIRMALVPRVLEARGLDVTPAMIKRLVSAGDMSSAAILELILEEEVPHVAIGTRWFRYCCNQRGLDAEQEFPRLLRAYHAPKSTPLNRSARIAAGFTEQELHFLEHHC